MPNIWVRQISLGGGVKWEGRVLGGGEKWELNILGGGGCWKGEINGRGSEMGGGENGKGEYWSIWKGRVVRRRVQGRGEYWEGEVLEGGSGCI